MKIKKPVVFFDIKYFFWNLGEKLKTEQFLFKIYCSVLFKIYRSVLKFDQFTVSVGFI
jgi:hypothetical protein